MNLDEISVNLKIIGVVHSKYKTTKNAPFQGEDEISKIENRILKKVIETFSCGDIQEDKTFQELLYALSEKEI